MNKKVHKINANNYHFAVRISIKFLDYNAKFRKWNEWKIIANKSNELKQKPLQLKYVNDQSVFHQHFFMICILFTMIFH